MGNEDLPNIYSMTAAVSMKKGKRTINREVWVITGDTMTPATNPFRVNFETSSFGRFFSV